MFFCHILYIIILNPNTPIHHQTFSKNYKELIKINIDLKKPNRFKELLNTLNDKIEDLMFSIVLKIPEKSIPTFLMQWLDTYTTKRIHALERENIQQQWKAVYLQDAVKSIREQDTEKVPTEE